MAGNYFERREKWNLEKLNNRYKKDSSFEKFEKASEFFKIRKEKLEKKRKVHFEIKEGG